MQFFTPVTNMLSISVVRLKYFRWIIDENSEVQENISENTKFSLSVEKVEWANRRFS